MVARYKVYKKINVGMHFLRPNNMIVGKWNCQLSTDIREDVCNRRAMLQRFAFPKGHGVGSVPSTNYLSRSG